MPPILLLLILLLLLLLLLLITSTVEPLAGSYNEQYEKQEQNRKATKQHVHKIKCHKL